MIAELLRQINRGSEIYSRKRSRFGDRSYKLNCMIPKCVVFGCIDFKN